MKIIAKLAIILLTTVAVFGQDEGPLQAREERHLERQETDKLASEEAKIIGEWHLTASRDRMTDRPYFGITTEGKLVRDATGYNRHGVSLHMVCNDGKTDGPVVSLRYLNPGNSELIGGGMEFFTVVVRFDSLPANAYRARTKSGQELFWVGQGGEPDRLKRHMRNSETMLVQVDQYGGSEIYEFSVADFKEAERWLSAKCAR